VCRSDRETHPFRPAIVPCGRLCARVPSVTTAQRATMGRWTPRTPPGYRAPVRCCPPRASTWAWHEKVRGGP
jgi:hypothetical protein